LSHRWIVQQADVEMQALLEILEPLSPLRRSGNVEQLAPTSALAEQALHLI
jgi:hypothetical protein